MWWLLVACAGPEPCPFDTSRGEDGRCYGETRGLATFDELLDLRLPDCEPQVGDGQIDLDTLCASGVCAGDSYATMRDAFGEPGSCYARTFDGHVLAECSWDDPWLGSYFDATGDPATGDVAPVEDAPSRGPLQIDSNYRGTTSEGLGPGIPLTCWIDALGEPEIEIAVDYDEEWGDEEPRIWTARWPARNVSLEFGGEMFAGYYDILLGEPW